ncbi:hypothetical protein ACO9S2_12650 [Nitrospira sp. NS4]|uniref:hypothetical protein n=1 Tax=Nitrospira sp. NS4 TaxID=3414498 RepID=UPI003C2C9FA0
MKDRHPPIQWRAIVQGVAIVYGITFAAGLVFAFNGITAQKDHMMYLLLALLTGAVGVAVALSVADTTRPLYLVAIGAGVWLLSSTSVLLGTQSLSDWVRSSAFIAATVVLGRLLIGIRLDIGPTPVLSFSPIRQKNPSAAQTRRTGAPRL